MNNKTAFAIFGGIGGLCLLIAAILLTFAIRGIQEEQRYLTGHCTITAKQLLEQFPPISSNSSNRPSYAPYFEFTVQTSDGNHYKASGYDGSNTFDSSQTTQQDILDSYSIGKTYSCWYDGTNPTHAVLARHPNWLLFFMSGILFLVGTIFTISAFFMLLGRVSWTAVPTAGGYSWRGVLRN